MAEIENIEDFIKMLFMGPQYFTMKAQQRERERQEMTRLEAEKTSTLEEQQQDELLTGLLMNYLGGGGEQIGTTFGMGEGPLAKTAEGAYSVFGPAEGGEPVVTGGREPTAENVALQEALGGGLDIGNMIWGMNLMGGPGAMFEEPELEPEPEPGLDPDYEAGLTYALQSLMGAPEIPGMAAPQPVGGVELVGPGMVDYSEELMPLPGIPGTPFGAPAAPPQPSPLDIAWEYAGGDVEKFMRFYSGYQDMLQTTTEEPEIDRYLGQYGGYGITQDPVTGEFRYEQFPRMPGEAPAPTIRTQDGDILRIDPETGEELWRIEAEEDAPEPPEWTDLSEEDRRYYFELVGGVPGLGGILDTGDWDPAPGLTFSQTQRAALAAYQEDQTRGDVEGEDGEGTLPGPTRQEELVNFLLTSYGDNPDWEQVLRDVDEAVRVGALTEKDRNFFKWLAETTGG